MPEDVYMQFINGSITESAAATLTEQEILTGCSVAGMIKNEAIGMEIREIILQVPMPEDEPATGAEEYIDFCLSTESGLTSSPNLDDVHCIYKIRKGLHAGVATYLPQTSYINGYPEHWQFIHPLLVPHPKIYAYIISSNSSAAAQVWYRIGFTYVRLTGPEVMEALEVWRSPTA